MGLVTICKYKRTSTPFFIEQAGINLYSLEELAWFLYHNICLADRQMFGDRLCRWLSEEAGCADLARRIQTGIAAGSSFQNLVLSVVGAADLYDSRELSELGERLKRLGSLQEQERLKMRADELLDNYSKEMLKKRESVEALVNRAVESKLAEALKAQVTLNHKAVSAEEFNKMFE